MYARKATFALERHKPFVEKATGNGRTLCFEDLEGERWVVQDCVNDDFEGSETE